MLEEVVKNNFCTIESKNNYFSRRLTKKTEHSSTHSHPRKIKLTTAKLNKPCNFYSSQSPKIITYNHGMS